MDMRTWGRWTVRSLRAAALTAALSVASTASAQYQGVPAASQASQAVKKTFTKNTTFNLPIQMEERVRASLREVQLYVKTGISDWVRHESVAPQTPYFTYRVPQDGEYWFALVTVDRAGKATPSDVNAVPPALRVVVDTHAPVLETSIAVEGNEPLLRVHMVDVNPDLTSVRAFVLTEQGDRALQPMPNHQGGTTTFRLSPSDLHAPIRVAGADMCGNLTTKDISGRDFSSNVASPKVAAVTSPNVAPPNVASPNVPQVTQILNPTPATLPSSLPALPTLTTLPPPVIHPIPTTTPAISSPPTQTTNIASTVYRPSMDTSERPANRKIINTTHASVDYRIDTVGPSGIGRVDVYLTPDKGQNWSKIPEDNDKRSPADIDLPGEGLFGIRLAITNGNGFGGKAPKAGDRPSFFIEVDTTYPFVQLQPAEMVAGSSAIDVRWTANDNNIAAEPVSIFYRTRPESTWQPVARNVKNDGVYRWVFPRDIGPQFFLKLEVADLAGNVTKVETPTPILLDLTEPEATLVDVTAVQGRAPTGAATTPTRGNP
jgi:hypothetical protein